MPEETLIAFADHGRVGQLVPTDGVEAEQLLRRFESAGIGVDALASRLQEEGKRSFVDSWSELLRTIESQLAEPQRS